MDAVNKPTIRSLARSSNSDVRAVPSTEDVQRLQTCSYARDNERIEALI